MTFFKDWIIAEEIFPNKTATVYHRTADLHNIESILSSGFEGGVSSNCFYGCGLYSTFDIRSQFDSYMSRYGDYLIKFKVTNLDAYLILQKQVAKYILGPAYKVSDQLKKFNLIDNFSQEDLRAYDQQQETKNYTGDLLKKMYEANKWIQHKLRGVVYRGEQDGYCLLKYRPVNDGTITMLAYANAPWVMPHDGIRWITSSRHVKIKSIYGSGDQEKRKQQSELGIDDYDMESLAYASKNKQYTQIVKYLQRIKNDTRERIVNVLMINSLDKEKMINLITTNKNIFSLRDIFDLIQYASYQSIDVLSKVISRLGKKNMRELSFEYLKQAHIEYREFFIHLNSEEKQFLLKSMIKNLDEFGYEDIQEIFYYAPNKIEIADMMVELESPVKLLRPLLNTLGSNGRFIYDDDGVREIKKAIKEIFGSSQDKEYVLDYIQTNMPRGMSQQEWDEFIDEIKNSFYY